MLPWTWLVVTAQNEGELLRNIIGTFESLEESCFYSLSCELLTFLPSLGYVFYSQGALGAVSMEYREYSFFKKRFIYFVYTHQKRVSDAHYRWM